MTSTTHPDTDLLDVAGTERSSLHHLRAAGVSVVIDVRDGRLPRILHWGADLGDLDTGVLERLAAADIPAVVTNSPDQPVLPGVLAEHAAGWPGVPGLIGHRGGTDWSTSFVVIEAARSRDTNGAEQVVSRAIDATAHLALTLTIQLLPDGLLRARATLGARGEAVAELTPFTVDGLVLSLPVPQRARELLDFTGRHLRERHPQRRRFDVGSWIRDNRRGRTGLDATTLMIAGTAGFDFGGGEVWAIHTAWSGNHRTIAERTPAGQAVLTGGELLLPGEIVLGDGGTYTSPWIYGSYGVGLDHMSSRFHTHLRGRPGHPTSPRPVILNTWESVYFDLRLPKLIALAERGAAVGVERYVLDDGWFLGRRSDDAGLGDWQVDPDVWPDGLHPLVDRVRDLGMQFGLWVEPEMINPESHLARAHPDWVLATGDRSPIPSRRQQVLDLGNVAAYDHIVTVLDALLTEYHISYLKWDHNRDLVDAGHSPHGLPGVHDQTVAVYRLMDELRRRHPGLEIESCSSGGGRVDLEVLQHTDRIWTSDCIDALERQTIQRYTGLLVPPELVGAHVGADRAHTTGRRHSLAFRAGTALFGHLGIEADLTLLSDDELGDLGEWVTLYKRLRPLLHTGTIIRFDDVDPSLIAQAVVAPDLAEAVVSIAAVATSDSAPSGRLVLRGLDPAASYRVSLLPPGDVILGNNHQLPPWLTTGTELPASVLHHAGLQMPDLYPEHLILLHLQRTPQSTPAGERDGGPAPTHEHRP